MASRPGIRACDIKAALKAEQDFGRPVRAISRGDVTIHFDDPALRPANEDIDRELAELEARHGQG
mgnify:CR=1 FL=1